MSAELLKIIDKGILDAEKYLSDIGVLEDFTHDFEEEEMVFTLGWDSVSKKLLANAWWYDDSMLPLSSLLFKHKASFFVHLPGFLQFCKDQVKDVIDCVDISRASRQIDDIIKHVKSSQR